MTRRIITIHRQRIIVIGLVEGVPGDRIFIFPLVGDLVFSIVQAAAGVFFICTIQVNIIVMLVKVVDSISAIFCVKIVFVAATATIEMVLVVAAVELIVTRITVEPVLAVTTVERVLDG